MSDRYSYSTQRPWLFTERGSVAFIKARDNAMKLLEEAGAFMAFSCMKGVPYGEVWNALAILDRMVELGDIREITLPDAAGQHRVFVRSRS